MSDRLTNILYVRPGIVTVGRIMQKAIQDVWQIHGKPTHPAASMDLSGASTPSPTLTECC
ncbi:MAG: hypothetical protein V7L00_22220 [Nostoc sp.]|uniref:hypothetical protein n=1 Tax=Nostoc sp. TaxID=1180 RepID=UPI002FF8F033